MQTVVDILSEIRPEFDFADAQDFFEQGMLDSFDLTTLIAALESRFNISIDATDIIPENFRNIDAIRGILRSYGATH